ncbi:MAG: hypothetical protein U0174_07225 [Polyangiaceae bacterium]
MKIDTSFRSSLLLLTLAVAPLGTFACKSDKPAEGPVEKAGKKVDNAGKEVKDSAKKVGDDVEDASKKK